MEVLNDFHRHSIRQSVNYKSKELRTFESQIQLTSEAVCGNRMQPKGPAMAKQALHLCFLRFAAGER
jgi:hypothetical protein